MQNAADAHLSAPGDDAEMFALAPVSLWLEDYSGLRQLFATWRHAGVTDLRAYLLDDSRRVKECSALIKVLKVNRATLALFEAPTVEQLARTILAHDTKLGQAERIARAVVRAKQLSADERQTLLAQETV